MTRNTIKPPLAALTLIALSAGATFAGPSVTIYSRDLGMVRETRTLELSGARDTVRLSDVPERLDFSSVRLEPSSGAKVGRLAWRWDLASGDGLLENARGRRVRVVSRGDRALEGTLVAIDGSWIVLRADDGQLASLSRLAVEEVRLAGPAGRISQRPTLEAVIEDARRGRIAAELSYLTGGLSWNAEHVLVRRGEREGTWSANVTVENSTGLDFVDADLKLVAGEPRRVTPPGPIPYPRSGMVELQMAKASDAGNEALEEQAFSEYHLYALGRPATLRDRETQSLAMILPAAVRFDPRYLVRPQDGNSVAAVLELTNRAGEGPAVPLPAGRVRVYEADASGQLQFAGETRIGHIPVGDKVKVEIGRAFDLTSERRVIEQRRISDRETETTYEVELHNRRSREVVIHVQDRVSGEIEVLRHSHPFERLDANTLEFKVPVPAGQEAKVRWTVRQRY